jgi:type II secretory pathway predicted ATPase ExeA
MKNKKLLNFYGLKWNPFENSVPNDSLVESQKINNFCWRIENLVMDGGYGLITGNPGTGKSVTLRILEYRLSQIPDIHVGVLTRPQSRLSDFYRELAEIFGVDFKSSNQWGGYKGLRKKWANHIESNLFRPVLLIDEAQEMLPVILNELRLLSSIELDSKIIITIILCGDNRLVDKLKLPDLAPFFSRMRIKMQQESLVKEELEEIITKSIARAGFPSLMSDDLIRILSEHSGGNIRSMMIMANNLLHEGFKRELNQLSESIFLETFGQTRKKRKKR